MKLPCVGVGNCINEFPLLGAADDHGILIWMILERAVICDTCVIMFTVEGDLILNLFLGFLMCVHHV